MNAIGISITLGLLLPILFLPRRWAAMGVIAAVCYLTQSQELELFTAHFSAIRIITLAGFIRVIARKEFSFSNLNQIDWALIIFLSAFFAVSILRSPEDIVYQAGHFYNGFLTYFTFRGLLNNPIAFRIFLKDIAYLILPFAILILTESVTGRNYFSTMGGVPEISTLREGYYRCQASFRSPITAGVFGSTWMILFVYMALGTEDRFRAMFGIVLGAAITIASHSSGPLMALISGIVAWMCWPLREKMRMARWGIIIAIISIVMVMKAPVWFIFARVSDVIGGGGWYRGNLIDKFVNNFGKWWLMGMNSVETANWAATKMPWGGVDVTNQFISVGIGGGLLSLLIFIALFKKSYQLLGSAMTRIRLEGHNSKQDETLLWGLGSVLLVTMMNFLSVSYFDQIYVIWYMLLAVISGMTEYYLRDKCNLVPNP